MQKRTDKIGKKYESILIISHFLLNPFENDSALSSQLTNYFRERADFVVQIEHPFVESAEGKSFVVKYPRGKKPVRVDSVFRQSFLPLTYLAHFLVSIWYGFRGSQKYDTIFACENLSFLSALVLKILGKADRIIYYTIDYTESRFQNSVLNSIYHFIDKLAVGYSNEIWVVSKEQISGRESRGIKMSKSKIKIVPIAFSSPDIKIPSVSRVNRNNLGYCGTLRESAGIRLLIESMPLILKSNPKAKLHVIGGGELLNEMKDVAQKLKINKSVVFYGRVEKHKDVVKTLTKCSVGIAPYKREKGSISLMSDPGKIKLYLACGLPVVTTGVATSSKMLEENKAGIECEYNSKSLASSICRVVSDRSYKKYRENAILLSRQFDPEVVFSKALDA